MAAEARTPGQRKRTRRELARRADVWEHFILFTDDKGNEKARCKRCNQVLNASQGTSSPKKHVSICSAQEGEAAAVGVVAAAAPPPPPCASLDEARKHLARMIALHGHDPSVLEDDCFRSFVRSLNPGFEVPSRVAIEKMCDGIADEARRDSFSRIRQAPGRFSYAVGKAKTIEAGEVMYVACNFIDDQWKLHKVVIDALMPAGEDHFVADGPILGVSVFIDAADDAMAVISQHEDRLSMVAHDFADDNIRTKLKGYIERINSDRNLSCTTATYVDNVLHSIAPFLVVPYIPFGSDVFYDMESLNLTRQRRLQLLSELGLDYQWAYDKHWCACYYSLEVIRKRGFRELAGAELCVKLLCKVWGQVYRSIQRISASTYPTSNLCLGELLKVREILLHELARFSGDDPDLQDGTRYFEHGEAEDSLRRASGFLDKAIQDSYLVWSVPLALDPRYKLRHIEFSFERAFGSEAAKYISEVTTKIKKLYDDYINEYGTVTAADNSDSANATSSAHPLDQAWHEHRRSQDIMAAQVNSSYPETQRDLDRYLQDPLVLEIKETDFDVLSWWKKNGQKYPMVARMARDALAMPTCSKLSSDQVVQVRRILRGYSKKSYRDATNWEVSAWL